MLWVTRISGLVLLAVTLLPFIPTGKWYVRLWDFPRLQIAVLLALPIACAIAAVFRAGIKWETGCWIVVLSGAFVWQLSHILPFSPLWSKEVPTTAAGVPTSKFMVVNLKIENANHQQVAQEIADERPDILLLIEPDEKWNVGLEDLRKTFKYQHNEMRDEGLGIALWSNLKLAHVETRYVVSERRASIWAKIELPDGQTMNFVGVHPTPPGLMDPTGESRRDSRVRDAELVLIAKEIVEQDDESWIVAGDFNDVAWSHTTRLFKRTSGLKDPRVGRSFMGTYMAQYPPLRCPIDHVFLSDGFTLGLLARKKITGSDHFAVMVTVSLNQHADGVTPEPQGDDSEDAENMVDEGSQDAKQRGVATE